MDRTELAKKLESFKQACIEKGFIDANKLEAIVLDEAYPGIKPTSFIINVIVNEQWLQDKYQRSALKELTDLLYEKADEQALENVLTLRLCKASFPFDTLVYPALKDGMAS